MLFCLTYYLNKLWILNKKYFIYYKILNKKNLFGCVFARLINGNWIPELKQKELSIKKWCWTLILPSGNLKEVRKLYVNM